MTADPGQPTNAVDLKHWRELTIEGAWIAAAILALFFLNASDQVALVMAAVILHSPKPWEPPQ